VRPSLRLVAALAAVAAGVSAFPASARPVTRANGLLGRLSVVTDSARSFAGQQCRPIPIRTSGSATPVGPIESCPGVRPGAAVLTGEVSPEGSGALCTFNFLFTDPKTRDMFAGTAGHCVIEYAGIEETTFAPGAPGADLPHWAQDGQGCEIGTFVYAVLNSAKDFALIKLNALGRSEATPAMCHFGGPVAMDTTGASSTATTFEHFGNGAGLGYVSPARTALASGMPNPDVAFVEGAITFGDSGSGIIDSAGRAVGVIVAIGGNGRLFTDGDVGPVVVTRLAPQVARAEQVLRRKLVLQTAPLT